MLYLYFGLPCSGSLLSDDIDEVAINWEISYESAVIKSFDVLVSSLGTHNNGGTTYFDLLMCECFQKKMLAPKITLETHGQSIRLPALAFATDSALHEPTKRHLPITNQMLNHFGEAFSEEFEIEYLGYERVGLSKTSPELPTIASPMDMIYLINEQPHTYDGRNFLPVISTPTADR